MQPDLGALRQFSAIVTHGGFRPAARHLGVTPSALSHAMRRLEAQLSVRLLNRTSRSVRPTPEGVALFARLAPAFAAIDEAVGAATAPVDGPAGLVRLNSPRLAAQTILAERLPGFVATHPAVRLEVAVDDRALDVVAEGFDAGIRFGRVLTPDVIAVPIGPAHDFTAAASPEYLARVGEPRDPDDLRARQCIGYRLADGRMFPWRFEARGAARTVVPDGRLVVTDPLLSCEAACAGVGIVYTATAFLAPALADGRLVRVLRGWSTPSERLHIYYSGRRQVRPALRALVRWLAEPQAVARTCG